MLHSIIDFHHPLETPHDGHNHRDFILADPPTAPRANNRIRIWVASADGTATWLFIASPQPRLVDILTGAVKPLPPFPDEERMSMENLRGVVYGDGTVFLYNFINRYPSESITAAIMCPDSATWTVMTKRLKLFTQPYAMYHDGKVLVLDGDSLWCFKMTTDYEGNGVDVGSRLESSWDLYEDIHYSHQCSYVLESHGELLVASVLARPSLCRYECIHPARALRVMVRTLQKESGGNKMQWVERDNRSLGNHMLLLGTPASFTAKLDEGGGCAYFVYWGGVFRYSFLDDETKVVKRLRPGCCAGEVCVWLRPSLQITSIQEIKERLEARGSKQDEKGLLFEVK
ncbi:unnamed protein product [Triticum turgidum subsp. durum]|uniref:KIB1-4 beta-propeller domain-containing protein n=1 Tax=Triticum turgidum subsp. durum TaxID=4567 RepID=A0A9R1BUW9_TRITD|nr:unnamed protein product [Triticum turgidum subsp. durum]